MEEISPLKIHELVGQVLAVLGDATGPSVLRRVGEQLILLSGQSSTLGTARPSSPLERKKGRSRSRSKGRGRANSNKPPAQPKTSTPKLDTKKSSPPKKKGKEERQIQEESDSEPESGTESGKLPRKSGAVAGARATWKTRLAEHRKRAQYAAALVSEVDKSTSDSDKWNRRAFLWNSLETLSDTWKRYKSEFSDWNLSKNPLVNLPHQEDKQALLGCRPGGVVDALNTANGHFVIARSSEWTLKNSN